MPEDGAAIQHVSDTAIWVAYYRALESERPDALFRDDLAKTLVGTRGRAIAENLKRSSRYTRWSVIIRTAIIDDFIRKKVAEGVDLVLNLGAGLDTRPYRLELPASLHWIEVDYPGIIEHKQRLLKAETPRMNLERITLDLADVDERRKLFARLNTQFKSILVLTEGVIPYLTEEHVASLADDLHAEGNFRFWIAEFFSPRIYGYFKTKQSMKRMKNAPFRFFPEDWFGLFRGHGWAPEEIKYLGEESQKLGRTPPYPWWVKLLLRFAKEEKVAASRKMSAYLIMARQPAIA